jgi:hypothetical protein
MPGVIDFMEEEGGPSGAVDITSSLLGGAKSRRGAGKSRVLGDEEDDGDAEFISAAINRQNKKAGTEVLKKTSVGKGKGKNKAASGTLSGGGSFQSMGESHTKKENFSRF